MFGTNNDTAGTGANTSDYTVGIICALPDESVAVQAFLDKQHNVSIQVHRNDNNSYELGEIGPHNVVIAVMPGGMYGTANAANAARDMVHTFPNVRIGFMVGIAGGAPSQHYDVRLGDVAVSIPGKQHSGVLQFDFGKDIQDQPFLRTGVLNTPPQVLLTTVNRLKARYTSKGHTLEEKITEALERNPRLQNGFSRPPADSDKLFMSDFPHVHEDEYCSKVCEVITPSKLVVRKARDKAKGQDDITVHHGLIASSNTLMRNAVTRDKIAAEKGVICFEMEVAGLMNHFPCMAIRGICDYADSHKDKKWQKFAAMSAAAYAKDLLLLVHPTEVESEKRLSEAMTNMQDNLNRVEEATRAIQADLHAMKMSNEAARVKSWLAPADPSTNAQKARESRYGETGSWFLESGPFTEWEHGSRRHVWVYGIPGSGKTVLTSTILARLAQEAGCITLSFFFDFSDVKKQTLDDMLRSLVFQLYVASAAESQKHVDDLLASHGHGKDQPDTGGLSACLKDMLQNCRKVFIVLDALDECDKRKTPELLKWMSDFIPTLRHVQLLATGRPHADIESRLRVWVGEANFIPLSQEWVNKDIASYIEGRVDSEDFDNWEDSPEDREMIKEKVGGKARGMFRWAACQLDSLAECLDREELEDALQSLPSDLNATYSRIIKSIPERHERKTIRLLQFLALAERPLALEEVVDIVAVRPDKRCFDEKDRMRRPPMNITGYCTSLVSLAPAPPRDRGPERVVSVTRVLEEDTDGELELQLSHFSVKEYLLSGSLPDFISPKPMVAITDTCLAYLGSVKKDLVDVMRTRYPFAQYAAEIWMAHARDAEETPPTLDAIVLFLQDEERLLLWASLWHPDKEDHPYPGKAEESPLYFACRSGLKATAKRLISAGADVNAGEGNEECKTALEAASERGDEETVLLLLDAGADVHTRGSSGSVLYSAIRNGHEATVRLLVDRGAYLHEDFGYKGYFNNSGSALVVASEQGYEAIARLLIDKNADVDAQGGSNGSALHVASGRGYTEMVKLMLDRGADINAERGDYGFALIYAAQYSREAVLRLLLRRGANVGARGHMGSALDAAVAEGNMATIRLLLDHKADINTKSAHGSPLYVASRDGREDIVRLLLDRGADADAEIPRDSGLYAASKSGHEAVVRLLLERGTNLQEQGNISSLTLQAALECGNEAVVRLLLYRGAEINTEICYDSALQTASGRGCEWIVQLLLDRATKLDINAKGLKGSALYLASQAGFTGTVRLLLDRGGDINAQGGAYGSALQVASQVGHEATVQLLLDREADVHAKSSHGSALHLASENGHREVARLLLERGADVDAKGGKYGSALQAASQHGDKAVVELLLYWGADVHARGGKLGSALLAAVSHGHRDHEAIVRLLLDQGADVNAQGGDDSFPLLAASQYGDEARVRVLLDSGADVNAYSEGRGSALQTAALFRRDKVVQLLLDRGASTRAKGRLHDTALMMAAKGNRVDTVRLLLDRGADIDEHAGRYGTALQAALSFSCLKVARLLIDRGANVNAKGGELGSALQIASGSGFENIVQLLLDRGADVGACEGVCGTPLSCALSMGLGRIVRLLLDRGADHPPVNTLSGEELATFQYATSHSDQ